MRSGNDCSERLGLELAEGSPGGVMKGFGLKGFPLRRVFVRSVLGLELAEASFGGFVKATIFC